MRIAIVSDIHGNRTAFEAVLNDLRETAPDLILHGGDLAQGGADPAGIVDHIRDLGWRGVLGNTDEMLFRPEALDVFAQQSPAMRPLLTTLQEMGAAASEALGEERLAWLRELPLQHVEGPMALVHASLASLWRAPGPEASDAELESVYGPLSMPIAVYAHIHRSYVREVSAMVVVNTGSVSLSYDGDPRAAYLLLDGLLLDGLLLDELTPTIRRVAYDVDREIQALATCGFPHTGWIAKILRSASPQLP